MKANYVTDTVTRTDVHLEHAVDHGVGFGQLWVVGPHGTFHIEFTKSALAELAKDAAELAANL